MVLLADSITGQTRLPDEVVVVDSSIDTCLEPMLTTLASAVERFAYIRSQPGLTIQRNIGVAASKGDVIQFFDDDVVLEPEFLEEIEKVYRDDSELRVFAAQGRIVNLPRDARDPAGSLTGLRNSLSGAVRTLFLLPDQGDGRVKISGSPSMVNWRDEPGFVDMLSGSCFSFRREVFQHVAFDESMTGYAAGEDLDISRQLMHRGMGAFYCPSARLTHASSGLATYGSRERARKAFMNRWYLLHKHGSGHPIGQAAFWWSTLGHVLLESCRADIGGAFGVVDGVRNRPRLHAPKPAPAQVVVQLSGGLGNQLFQYATGRAAALDRGGQLKLDQSNYSIDPKRTYALDPFAIRAVRAHTADIPWAFRRSGSHALSNRVARRLQSRIGFSLDGPKVVRERHFHFDPDVIPRSGSIYLAGYWQSHRYFEQAAAELRHELTFRVPPGGLRGDIADRVAAAGSVGVHVRRGDYVSDPATHMRHGVCPAEYYRRALEEVAKRAAVSGVFVFSDDIDWARRELVPPWTTTYVSGESSTSDLADFYLMALCAHHVISNSSFSWWAAWLGAKANSVVVAPRQWFAETGMGADDMIPTGWILV